MVITTTFLIVAVIIGILLHWLGVICGAAAGFLAGRSWLGNS
jgi:hypothetical protein